MRRTACAVSFVISCWFALVPLAASALGAVSCAFDSSGGPDLRRRPRRRAQGNSGNDRFDSEDGVVDDVIGGTGDDTAHVDAGDDVRGCETVD